MNTIFAPTGPTRSRCFFRFHYYYSGNNITVNELKIRRQLTLEKKREKGVRGFFKITQEVFDNYLQDKTTATHTKEKSHLVCIERSNQPISENPMAKTNRHFRRTDQNTPQNFYRKDFMSSKEKNKWTNLAKFSPRGYDDDEERQVLPKKLHKKSLRVRISFGTKLETFKWRCNTWKPHNQT